MQRELVTFCNPTPLEFVYPQLIQGRHSNTRLVSPIMTTQNQISGGRGEKLVAKTQLCPSCKKKQTLKTLPTNFKCADIICDFCGFLAQVKTFETNDIEKLPPTIPGAAWKPQRERMESGIYYPLYIVAFKKNGTKHSIWYLPTDLQTQEMFTARKPLKPNAKRAGWQGFTIDLKRALSQSVRLK